MSRPVIVTLDGVSEASFPHPSVVMVDEGGLRPSTFALSYVLQLRDGDFDLLKNDALGPDAPVVIQVAPGGAPQTLLRGVILRQSIELAVGGDGSMLEATGADVSAALNHEHRSRVWSDVSDSMVVEQICAEHALIPQVESTSSVHAEAKHSLVQRESDLEFVYRLTRRNGYWFWIETDPSGKASTAHFKRPPVQGKPTVVLSLRAGQSNIEGASLFWDTDRPSAVTAQQLDLSSLAPNDGSVARSPLTGLATKALADVVKTPRRRQLAVPVSDLADLQARAEALLIETGWFVSARVTAKFSVLKHVVRANTLVTLDGAGTRHSGNYLVSRVVHLIDANDHLMTIDLVRNGWN